MALFVAGVENHNEINGPMVSSNGRLEVESGPDGEAPTLRPRKRLP
jgi:hypothetical protein